ncbi:hypothetical protein D3C81_431820 [compost metagenome]
MVCARDSGDEQRSTIFANALQDRYALKKSNTSASLGVGILGSVSMPIGSTDDSMVKVASETVTSAKFYERYFALVESFLPKEQKKKISLKKPVEKPAPALGMPEASPAPDAATLAPVPAPAPVPPVIEPAPAPQAPAAEAAAAPVVDDSKGSMPVAPPVDTAPINVEQPAPAAAEPVSTEVPVVPANNAEQAPQ